MVKFRQGGFVCCYSLVQTSYNFRLKVDLTTLLCMIYREIQLQHRGGGNEDVTWSEDDTEFTSFSLSSTGAVTVRGEGVLDVSIHLSKYPHIRATGRFVDNFFYNQFYFKMYL